MWDWEWIDYDCEQSNESELENVTEEQAPADFSVTRRISATLLSLIQWCSSA